MATTADPFDSAALRVVPRRHPGRWVAAALALLAFAARQIDRALVGQFLTAPAFLAELLETWGLEGNAISAITVNAGR